MRTFFQILLWSIAIQGILFLSMSPQACTVPNHLFAFPLAPSLAVGIAAFRRCPLERVGKLMLLSYLVAIGTRVIWIFTPWRDTEYGLIIGLFLVPLICFRLIPKCGGPATSINNSNPPGGPVSGS